MNRSWKALEVTLHSEMIQAQSPWTTLESNRVAPCHCDQLNTQHVAYSEWRYIYSGFQTLKQEKENAKSLSNSFIDCMLNW